MLYANNKGADQSAHPRSLISTFIVRCLDNIIPCSVSRFTETDRNGLTKIQKRTSRSTETGLNKVGWGRAYICNFLHQ